ncbi:trypsin family [Scenedesmus sp. NREL 46B-D3]|nr:trypsin family [Scenedesmus sp. NREL 46B-D3]
MTLLGPGAAAAKSRMTPDEQVTIDIFKRSTPSVVNVTNLTARRDAFTMNMLEIPQGAGSGFIWDDAGHVITNYHVITDASDIQVTLMGGAEYSAKVIGVDQDKDVAVLQMGVDADKNPPPPGVLKALPRCSNSSDLLVGQKLFAIGNPFGLDHTLTTGVVSGTGREIASISGRPIADVIQTDAAINPGNSGGPLLDSGGCLIGINTAIYSPSGANSGVGFAIPVDVVNSSVEQIISNGKVVRPILGISFAPDQSSEQLGVKGILVLNAREGGPAWRAGIRGTSRDEYGRLVLGDIITAVNGAKVRNSSDLYKALDKSAVGDSLDIEVLRGNAKEHVNAVLEANA